MMKWIRFFLAFLFFSIPLKAQDITQFDFPLLLGDWYWFSPYQNDAHKEGTYKAINIRFTSDNRFWVKLLDRNGNIEEGKGAFDLDETTMVLSDDYGDAQYHKYALNHNQLMLKDTEFTKILPHDLSGAWYSDVISGNDVDQEVAEFALMLRADFLFSVRVLGKEGQSVTRRGVYFLEDDHLVLIYREGQQDSQFQLDANTLILSNSQFDMKTVLKRKMP